eukprot:Selendium_serpulae@DN3409_c0_g1_i1.p1
MAAPLRLALLCAALSMCVESGHALRCAQPSPSLACESIRDAPLEEEERYIVFHGALSFDPAALPVPRDADAPLATQFDAEFSFGRTLNTEDEENEAISYATDGTPVTVVVECLSVWCGALQPGAEYIFFTKYDARDESLQLTVDVCNTMAIGAASREALWAATECAPRVRLSAEAREALRLRSE